jgi:hypothetical protein
MATKSSATRPPRCIDANAILLCTLGLAAVIAAVGGTADATTIYTWTNGGVANDIDDPNNWDQATAPASGSKLGNVSVGDIIRFDSEAATLPTTNIDLVRIGGGNAMSNFDLRNGSLNFNRAEVYHLGSTTFTVGDGDMTTLARANFSNGTINLNRDGGAITYVVNADGTMKMNNNIDFGQRNSVVRLVGGYFDGSGRTVNSNFTNFGENYVSFEEVGSTFTVNYGGQLPNLAEVQNNAGSGRSFRLGGALASNPNASLSVIDNGSSFTVGVVAVPEPGGFGLAAAGLLSLAAFCRRRMR